MEKKVGDLVVQDDGRDIVYVCLGNSWVQIENQGGVIVVTAHCNNGQGRDGVQVCEIDPIHGIKEGVE